MHKARSDLSLDDGLIFGKEEVDQPNSSEHLLEEPMNTTDKWTRRNAFNDETVAEDPTTSDFRSIDNLQQETTIN